MLVRFLHVQAKTVEAVDVEAGTFNEVPALPVDGSELVPWDEATEQEVTVEVPLARLLAGELATPFERPGGRRVEPVHSAAGRLAGRTVRRRWPVMGAVRLSAERLEGPYGLVRLRLVVENASAWHDPGADRAVALRHSLVAAHSLLGVDQGVFLSLLDPPEWAKPAAEACQNLHTWPVLIGDEGRRDAMLSSPIILYDHPTIAPESPGDLFDSTEIDEILTLRTMALTEDEKREARATDERAAAIIDRVDNMPPELLERLHGAVRYLKGVEGAAGREEAQPRAGAVVGPGGRPDGVAGDRRGGGGRGRGGQGEPGAACARASAGPTPRTCSWPAGRPPSRRCSWTSTATATWPSPSTRTRRPTCSAGTAATCTSRPTRSSPDEPVRRAAAPGPGRRRRQRVPGRRRLRGRGGQAAGRARPCPAGSGSGDFGIRGVHLAYELLEGYEAAILVDAAPRGEAPGTVYVIEPDLDGEPDPAVEDGTGVLVDAHGMEPDAVFALLKALGRRHPQAAGGRLRAGRGVGADGAQPAGRGRGRPGRGRRPRADRRARDREGGMSMLRRVVLGAALVGLVAVLRK